MAASHELKIIADALSAYQETDTEAVDEIFNVADGLNKSFSGSWLGYHSRVYYENFQTPPAGAVFSPEWGLMGSLYQESVGDWCEYAYDDVIKYINKKSKNPSANIYDKAASEVAEEFDELKSQALSIIHSHLPEWPEDKFLSGLLAEIEKIEVPTQSDFINIHRPSGKLMSRDMNAIQNGIHTPPHIAVMCKIMSIKAPYNSCGMLSKLLLRLSKHINNIERKKVVEDRMGVNVFIGHGRSPLWRELKDYIKDKLNLPYDEFNRTPVAGMTNIARLSQMLEQSRFAFLLMTAEDENAEGRMQARMNVIHEVGLFQGRLGFEKAIVILEEGCDEFTNIQGLGQIRFPRGNITAAFHEIRDVLEREGLVK